MKIFFSRLRIEGIKDVFINLVKEFIVVREVYRERSVSVAVGVFESIWLNERIVILGKKIEDKVMRE